MEENKTDEYTGRSCMKHFELFKIPMYGFLLCVGGKNVLTHFLYFLSNLILTAFS